MWWQCLKCAKLFPQRGHTGAKEHYEAITLKGMDCELASSEALGELLMQAVPSPHSTRVLECVRAVLDGISDLPASFNSSAGPGHVLD